MSNDDDDQEIDREFLESMELKFKVHFRKPWGGGWVFVLSRGQDMAIQMATHKMTRGQFRSLLDAIGDFDG